MQKVTKNVDALGFDKWQIADVRRAYQSNKTTYTKMNRLAEKINALAAEYNAQKAELEAWEGPVKIISQKVLGMELTSQEVLAYHKDPALFAQRYPDHPVSAAICAMYADGTVAQQEEDPEAVVTEETAQVEAPSGDAAPSITEDVF